MKIETGIRLTWSIILSILPLIVLRIGNVTPGYFTMLVIVANAFIQGLVFESFLHIQYLKDRLEEAKIKVEELKNKNHKHEE